jgi:hypothetical protein
LAISAAGAGDHALMGHHGIEGSDQHRPVVLGVQVQTQHCLQLALKALRLIGKCLTETPLKLSLDHHLCALQQGIIISVRVPDGLPGGKRGNGYLDILFA